MMDYSTSLEDSIHKQARVQFFKANRENDERIYAETVLCKDLYAEQIEREKNGTSQYTFFQDQFDAKFLTFCPNVTETMTIDSKLNVFMAEVVPCSKAAQTDYAEGIECDEPTDHPKDFQVYIKQVSTSFDPNIYAEE